MLGAYGISKAADLRWRAASPSSGARRTCASTASRPGLVKTDFARALWEDPEQPEAAPCRPTPLRRIGEPDEIGGIVAFLASKAPPS